MTAGLKAHRRRHSAVRRAARGLTLLEVMVAVAIVGILAAVAMPGYGVHLMKSRRAEAQAYLQTVAVREQQFLLDTRSFAALDGIGVTVPTNVTAYYTLSLSTSAGPPPTYTLTATPKLKQVDDACGTLSIDQAGTKSAAKSGCW